MSATLDRVHPVLNRDREEIRVPKSFGPPLESYLSRRGVRATVRTDAAGDLLVLQGEPDMSRVKSLLSEWEAKSNPN